MLTTHRMQWSQMSCDHCQLEDMEVDQPDGQELEVFLFALFEHGWRCVNEELAEFECPECGKDWKGKK